MDSSLPQFHTITITLPENTPQAVLDYLEQLKQTGDRTFSNKISQLLIESLNRASLKEKPHILIPLPEHLTEEQLDWFNHPFTKHLLTNWISQLAGGTMPLPFSNHWATSPMPSSIEPSSPEPSQPEIHSQITGNKVDVPGRTEPDHAASPPGQDSFRISTSYHNKLVGFFLDED
ncbi:hypothetical protein G5B47_17665 [Paenibacillus sp. 7124]|uniref:Uncharacterized protein n=1 Tax=Paenibacillus apii TaxID=1850370 RepID=A0A6M1PQB3_9BACL|nr:hypothetical protein [Paenibacillus apii]NGM84242.1 hypothetical protein [Paenibacillus apii]NJJ40863.1 hypothetical protein [Paenibacillus apii]